MSKWSIKAQRRSGFRLSGCGFSTGGHRTGGIVGKSWFLFLPLVILSLTREQLAA